MRHRRHPENDGRNSALRACRHSQRRRCGRAYCYCQYVRSVRRPRSRRQPMYDVLNFAVEEINGSGGLLGRQIKVVS